MKHVFESGITGESYDGAGDEFLRGMMAAEKEENLGPLKPLEETDVTFEIEDHALCAFSLADSSEAAPLLADFIKRALARGYQTTVWRDEAGQATKFRMRKLDQN